MAEKNLEGMVQRLNDIHEIQNVMSLHEYYHTAGMHKEEVEEIWAQKTPGVSWETGDLGRFEGIDAIWKIYVDGKAMMGEANLKGMRTVYPQIEDKKENEFIGTMNVHMLTTPMIEVAGDGKTAKGIWMSPGHVTQLMGDKLTACWMWEKYAVDFVKEDGKWKIWHFHVYTDFQTPYEKSWLETSLEPKLPPVFPPDFPKSNKPMTDDYPQYSPFTTPKNLPRPPVPYETFSDTFSY
jgi:hypothetical protein